MCRFVKGIMMGTVIGMATAMMMIPSMDRKTQRTMKRAGRRMMDMAEDTYDGVMDLMR